ncbi:replication initiator protein [Capybara microvirus Cap1_SP_206]|nr:replication initiator protein [Capybara microvirus Cap1_SP_206]
MCLRPLHYFQSDIMNESTGKYYGFVTGYQTLVADYNDFKLRDIPCTLAHRATPIKVACGRCCECLNAKKMSWVGRAVAELETSKYGYFLSITYNNDHVLPKPEKREIQLFIKRLRKHFKLRYLTVGELGSLTDRAHYHMILYSNQPINDLVYYSSSGSNILYTSELIDSCWQKGSIKIGRAEASSIAYTVGYIVSKEKKTCFKLQSQGLGFDYFKNLNSSYVLSTGRGKELYVRLPRYLKEKYGLKSEFDSVKAEREWKNKVFGSGLDEEDYRDFKQYLSEHKLIVH